MKSMLNYLLIIGVIIGFLSGLGLMGWFWLGMYLVGIIFYFIGFEVGKDKERMKGLFIPCEKHTFNETGYPYTSFAEGRPKYYCRYCRNGFDENYNLIPFVVGDVLNARETEWIHGKEYWQQIEKYLTPIFNKIHRERSK